MLWVGLLPIILIALITPITTPLPYCTKKRPRPEGRSRPAIKKPYSTKRVFFVISSSSTTWRGSVRFLLPRPVIEAIASEAVRYTLKTFPKSRINPNCRVIQIVTLFICVGAVLAPCYACDCVGTRPARTTESCYPRREVVAPQRRSVVVTPRPTNGEGPLFRFSYLLKISDRT